MRFVPALSDTGAETKVEQIEVTPLPFGGIIETFNSLDDARARELWLIRWLSHDGQFGVILGPEVFVNIDGRWAVRFQPTDCLVD